MRLVFDVLASNDSDSLLATLRSGVSMSSPVAPIRLTLNSERKILAIVTLDDSDVCLGPFTNCDKGLEEAVYDAIHLLASKGLIEEYHLAYADETTLIGRYNTLDTALRSRRSLIAMGAEREPLVSLKMKPASDVKKMMKLPGVDARDNGEFS